MGLCTLAARWVVAEAAAARLWRALAVSLRGTVEPAAT
jgi:hypothetical protein